MERRLLLAVSLMVLVLVGPSFFRKPAPPRAVPRPDTTAAVARPPAPAPGADAVVPAPVAPAGPAFRSAAAPRADTASLAGDDAIFRFTSVGAALDGVFLPALRSFHPGDTGAVQLVRPGDRMLVTRLLIGADTVRFDSVAFAIESRGPTLRMRGPAGALAQTVAVTPVTGRPYLLDVAGRFEGLEGRGATLIVGLGAGFANVEADSNDNYRSYAVAVRRSGVENTNFRSVDPGEVEALQGPFDWVAVKSKYFMGVLLSADSTRPQLGGALLVGGPRPHRIATHTETWVTMPVGPDGRYRYQVYLGPKEHAVLHPMGRDLDVASPYGWIFRPIVMPVATWITQFFLWTHENLGLGYGMVLVVFGVLIRLLLWPLNQKAMKSQVAMMAVQPILKDIQTRYKNDPQKLQSEMMRVYKEHSVNPLGGCLPLLLPMPILLALFFVFANTIELRGTPFLWLPDLSLRDPLFITPVVMGLSMFGLSKLSQMGMPPNPQAKMMTVFMPIMMTVLFLNFASGLNLYYAVSNIVSLPQQWLINRSRAAEMARRQVAT
jgi:YidC/Oxa1 family membrane protein insertase